jgi:hypothetical protein
VGTLLRVLPLAPLVLIAVLTPPPREPSLRATAATGSVKLTDSRGGGAIVSAAHMDPGDSVTGTVTISNGGDAPAALRLSKSQLLDTPGLGGGRLSEALFLAVDDLTAGRRVYDGPLASMLPLPVAPIPAGGGHSFRFTVRLPQIRGALYQVAFTTVRFDWSATALPKPRTTPPPPPDTRAPRLVLSGKRRQTVGSRGLLVYARCNEPCTLGARAKVLRVRGLRRGRVTPRVAAAATLHRVAIRIRFSRRALRRLKRAVRRGRVVVTVTARDAAGNRTAARRGIRLRRQAHTPGGYLQGQGRRAAVDRPVGAGDVGGPLGAEKGDHRGDLVLAAEAPQR